MKFFQNLFCKIKYRNSGGWCNVCEIDDTDMKIIVYRMGGTNHIQIEMFDKDPLTNNYVERDIFTSHGNPKYNNMPGFAEHLTCEEINLNEIIKANE
jgi:hypothetical protein